MVDLDAEREDAVRTLVVANQTVESEPLHERIVEKSGEGNHLFTVVVPASGGAGDPHERLAHLLKRLSDEGIQAVGQVGHPDPFTAIQNAMQFYAIDDILISTFEGERSGWLRANLIERVKAATSRPVEHVVSTPREGRELMESASIAAEHAHGHDEHHGPPAANQSSRVEPQMLGMLLFIISEIMLFGAFFTAYFFIRVVADNPWPARGRTCRSRSPA